MDYSVLDNARIVPVVVLNDIDKALSVIGALRDGGIKIAEITFRTACAAEAIRLARSAFADMVIGAGTVINGKQCADALAAGAQFIVSPGFSAEVLEVCESAGVPYLPGTATPTEIMTALAAGLSVLKFFPAEALGGIKTLKALAAAFPGVSFMPTGGIGIDTFTDYLALPFIRAVGGSWMMKGDAENIKAVTEETVRRLNK